MKRCVLAIPDAGPLISLHMAGALDLLLALDMPIVLVDEVYAELVSDPEYAKDRAIEAFVRAHKERVRIVETDVGILAREARAAGTYRAKRNLGEAAIADFIATSIPALAGPESPVLLLFEDADIKRLAVLARGHVHLLSTKGLLVGMEENGIIPSAEALMAAMAGHGRDISLSEAVDIPAETPSGKSSWSPAA